MPRSRALVQRGRVLGVATVAAVSLSQVGFAEQSLEQLPKDVISFSLVWVALPQTMAEVTKDHGPLAGVSWGVVKGTGDVAGRVMDLLDEGPASERRAQALAGRRNAALGGERRSPEWLNVRRGGSPQARHEPAFLRYTF